MYTYIKKLYYKYSKEKPLKSNLWLCKKQIWYRIQGNMYLNMSLFIYSFNNSDELQNSFSILTISSSCFIPYYEGAQNWTVLKFNEDSELLIIYTRGAHDIAYLVPFKIKHLLYSFESTYFCQSENYVVVILLLLRLLNGVKPIYYVIDTIPGRVFK